MIESSLRAMWRGIGYRVQGKHEVGDVEDIVVVAIVARRDILIDRVERTFLRTGTELFSRAYDSTGNEHMSTALRKRVVRESQIDFDAPGSLEWLILSPTAVMKVSRVHIGFSDSKLTQFGLADC